MGTVSCREKMPERGRKLTEVRLQEMDLEEEDLEEETGFGPEFQDITSLLIQDSSQKDQSTKSEHLCSLKFKICISLSVFFVLLFLFLLYLAYSETDVENDSLTNLMIDLPE